MQDEPLPGLANRHRRCAIVDALSRLEKIGAMDIKTLIPIMVQGSLFRLVLTAGMRSHWNDPLHAFRKPAGYGRGIVAVNVVVYLAACLLTALLLFLLTSVVLTMLDGLWSKRQLAPAHS